LLFLAVRDISGEVIVLEAHMDDWKVWLSFSCPVCNAWLYAAFVLRDSDGLLVPIVCPGCKSFVGLKVEDILDMMGDETIYNYTGV
jgi:hypothetical protein